ncbi:MAG: penicillin-insensitive murein endopeptidase [Peptococcaceae bacterium]|jgi:peptidoglycan hydrolase-like protein with peptidoglycan-binding domain|nr:penicillin-insensitive murein endopeptidase [Peptococcaceae bacterium]
MKHGDGIWVNNSTGIDWGKKSLPGKIPAVADKEKTVEILGEIYKTSDGGFVRVVNGIAYVVPPKDLRYEKLAQEFAIQGGIKPILGTNPAGNKYKTSDGNQILISRDGIGRMVSGASQVTLKNSAPTQLEQSTLDFGNMSNKGGIWANNSTGIDWGKKSLLERIPAVVAGEKIVKVLSEKYNAFVNEKKENHNNAYINLSKGNANNNFDQVRALQYRLNELGFRDKNEQILNVDGAFGDNTLTAVQKYKDQYFPDENNTDYRGIVDNETWVHLGLTTLMSDIINVLDFSSVGFVRLPQTGGIGYDTSGCSEIYTGNHQWGTPYTISCIQDLGTRWNVLGYETKYGKIPIGDISLQNGGYFPPHGSHQIGIDVDITTSGFTQDANRKLIQEILKTGDVVLIFYNDEVLLKEFPDIVQYYTDHDTHLHIRYER